MVIRLIVELTSGNILLNFFKEREELSGSLLESFKFFINLPSMLQNLFVVCGSFCLYNYNAKFES